MCSLHYKDHISSGSHSIKEGSKKLWAFFGVNVDIGRVAIENTPPRTVNNKPIPPMFSVIL